MQNLPRDEGIAGFSLKALLFTAIGILLFGIYVKALIYGENSLTVLNSLKENKESLKIECRELKRANQKLQKSYFEYKQLVPKQLESDAL